MTHLAGRSSSSSRRLPGRARSAEIASRGIEAAEHVTYPNGVRRVIYRDVDGTYWLRRRSLLGHKRRPSGCRVGEAI